MISHRRFLALSLLFSSLSFAQSSKPAATLDEYFNVVGFTAARPSPDGSSVVIATERADWDGQFFREELWLYRNDGHGAGKLTQLTQSGHDSDPHWSPDGQWIAFLSERKISSGKDGDGSNPPDQEVSQIYLISPNGGEAFPLTQGEDDVHSFSWSADSRLIYNSTRTPWTKQQNDAYKKEWKDVIQYRASERGDTIFSLSIADAIARRDSAPSKERSDADASATTTPGAQAISISPWRVEQLQASPDGHRLAFTSSSISQRQEKVNAFEIYTVDLTGQPPQAPKQITRNEAVETDLRWSPDSRHVFFRVDLGSVEGKYKDTQTRLYWVDADNNQVQRWASDFGGAVAHYSVTSAGGVIAAGKLGTEVQTYTEAAPDKPFTKVHGLPGWYEIMSGSDHSPCLAFVHSSVEKPTEIYFAESVDKLVDARPISAFNKLFTERDLPKGKPYQWKSDDGTSVEGMLIYPPGKFEAKNLPMLVLIHGGPADADGNHFEADWYQWDRVAATAGWLVFEPNYRGSSGYGDKFLMEIVPQLVSRPGRDILTGVDALVKDGIADPNLLSIGEYSYGGYMTNWLITQTTRFKAAVTGAGAVEHVANWGNDDTTMDDAYFLGGRPWEAAQRYHDEGAIFQMDKVRTPTHVVAGADDIRVAVLEDYLLDHALFALDIPSQLLLFPGEGHGLGKNPWHGKIKVREELKWLQKYGGVLNPNGKQKTEN